MKRIIPFLLFVFLLTLACSNRVNVTVSQENVVIESPQSSNRKAKNIILMIGDGMGLSQITAGMLANNFSLNLETNECNWLTQMPLFKQFNYRFGCGGNSFSTGSKTYNGAIAVDDDSVAMPTILEQLSAKGYATGLVASCNITHATPAAFFAHQPSRGMYYEIAADLSKSPIDVFVAGGRIHFENRTNNDRGKPDDRNIMEEMEAQNFTFVNSFDALTNTNGRAGYFYSDDHPPSVLNGRGDMLPQSVQPVISKLQKLSDKGFFLMIEGAQIDWGGHANNSDYIISEMLDFDTAVGNVLDFAEKDGNTLVLVTADHETGGYAINGGELNGENLETGFTTGKHTASMIPLFAFGPGAEHFSGIYENSAVYFKMWKTLNVEE